MLARQLRARHYLRALVLTVVALGAPALCCAPADAIGGTGGQSTGASGPAVQATGAAVAPDSRALPGLEAQESAVDLRVAALSDQVTSLQAGLVGARHDQEQAQTALSRVEGEVKGLVVGLYVDSGSLPPGAEGLEQPYAEVAQQAGRNLLAGYRGLVGRYRARVAADDRALAGLHRVQAQLAAQQGALQALVAAGQARLERERSAAAAALAASDAARQAVMAAQAPSAGHLAATEAQQHLLASKPFGPVTPGTTFTAAGPAFSGIASWYGPGFDGQPTASGAIYDENLWTVASRDLPLGTVLLVSANGRSVLLLVNDRGPYVAGRVLDLSHAAAQALGSDGLIEVTAQPVSLGS